MYSAPGDRCTHTTRMHSTSARSIILHSHHRHFRAGHDGTGMLQRGIGGLERRDGRVVDFGHGGDLLVLHVCDGVRGYGDLGVFLAGFLVRRCVKGEEEKQIRGEDGAAGHSGKGLSRAFADVGHGLEVGAGKVVVGRIVYEAYYGD